MDQALDSFVEFVLRFKGPYLVSGQTQATGLPWWHIG